MKNNNSSIPQHESKPANNMLPVNVLFLAIKIFEEMFSLLDNLLICIKHMKIHDNIDYGLDEVVTLLEDRVSRLKRILKIDESSKKILKMHDSSGSE